ncbi:MAG: peroxiredoxin [Gammaproteobacteria bacterium]|nr:peroxiredoxin [Gammaproteobacteria bacterium]MDH3464567.1 peroxiredoxin [Gammaproteobacteria bacterium]
MTIKVGDRIPNVTVYEMSDKGPSEITTDAIFSGKKVVLFALPGAYTPTCSASHLPGYVVYADAILDKGVERIVCLSVNDAWVMDAWGKSHHAEKILMLADGSADLTQALGLELDLTKRGMGVRSDRYAMIVEDGVVTHLNREAPGKFEVSDAETILKLL